MLFLSLSASVADADEYGKSDRAMMRHLPEEEREKIQQQVGVISKINILQISDSDITFASARK